MNYFLMKNNSIQFNIFTHMHYILGPEIIPKLFGYCSFSEG